MFNKIVFFLPVALSPNALLNHGSAVYEIIGNNVCNQNIVLYGIKPNGISHTRKRDYMQCFALMTYQSFGLDKKNLVLANEIVFWWRQ